MRGLPSRHQRAFDALALNGTERVLEIGCGHGIATGLIASALTTGHLIAIDASPKMIFATARRNAEHIQSGRLSLIEDRFETAEFNARFDAIFAVNFDFPSRSDATWADRLKGLLKPNGRLCLILEAPEESRARTFANAATEALIAAGMTVTETCEGKTAEIRALNPAR